MKELEITGGDYFLKFTIYRNLNFDPMRDNSIENVGVESGHVGVESGHVGVDGDKYSIVLRMIRENSRITAMEMAIQLHTTTRTAERILRHLKQNCQ